jgi:hypothetical protein
VDVTRYVIQPRRSDFAGLERPEAYRPEDAVFMVRHRGGGAFILVRSPD